MEIIGNYHNLFNNNNIVVLACIHDDVKTMGKRKHRNMIAEQEIYY